MGFQDLLYFHRTKQEPLQPYPNKPLVYYNAEIYTK